MRFKNLFSLIFLSISVCYAQEYDNYNEFAVTFSCPLQTNRFLCNSNNRFSELDGSCNNIQRPWLGKSNVPYKRYFPASYADGFSTPRSTGVSGRSLPNSRFLSRFLSFDNSGLEFFFSHMLTMFGQFIAHDLTSSQTSQVNCDCSNSNPECISVSMPSMENIMRMSCMRFARTMPSFPTLDCGFRRREQLNALTSFIDGSQIYGSNLDKSNRLRAFQGGLLRMSPGNFPSRSFLPLSPNENCGEGGMFVSCFLAGEERANENLGLLGIQILFMREHNRIATELTRINPHWDDQRLFQETRKIVIAIYQNIIFSEWLPLIIGRNFASVAGLLPLFDGFYSNYDPNVNPTIANEFAAGAFRFGHTMVRNTFSRYNGNNFVVAASVNVSQTIFRTSQAFNANAGGVDSIFLGLINDPAAKFDTHINEQLQNHLFEFIGADNTIQAIDLLAANINRGRDHGIPSYVSFRQKCGLRQAFNFNDLSDVMSWENIQKLQSLYENVQDIDLYVGGLSETPLRDGAVGATFACIIANQFKDLKRGDRFYYENGPSATSFTIEQLREIRRVSLSRLICNDFDINSIQRNSFMLPSNSNPRVSCNDIPRLDLNRWWSFN